MFLLPQFPQRVLIRQVGGRVDKGNPGAVTLMFPLLFHQAHFGPSASAASAAGGQKRKGVTVATPYLLLDGLESQDRGGVGTPQIYDSLPQ